MKLTIEQLRAAAKGAVCVVEEEDGVHFERFTESERVAYIDNIDYTTKTHATAGVRLEFITDSKTLTLSATMSHGCSRLWFAFEVFANGKKVGELGNGDTERFGKFSERFVLGEGMKRVCVYFPWSAVAVVKEASLDENACFIPVKRDKKLLMFGDSITQGYDARHPSATYASRLADTLGVDAYNKGVGGDLFRPALAAADCGLTPDIITVAYGTNDWACGDRKRFEWDCRVFYETLSRKYPHAKIFAFTPIWRADHAADMGWSFTEMCTYIRGVAAALPNVTAVNGWTLVPHDTALYADGYLHPTDEGFGAYFENLIGGILEHLQ